MCVYTPAMLTRCIMLYLSDLQCAMQARLQRGNSSLILLAMLLPSFTAPESKIEYRRDNEGSVSSRRSVFFLLFFVLFIF